MTSLSLCSAIRAIVQSGKNRVKLSDRGALELDESAKTSKCDPIRIRHREECWALRLSFDDHLRFLADLPVDSSVKKLPDYLLFAEPPGDAVNVSIRVLVGELKSSETGVEKSAARQVQLGKLLAEYLIRIARLHLKLPDPLTPKDAQRAPQPSFAGLIVSPNLPSNILPKGTTKGQRQSLPHKPDDLYGMPIYYTTAGSEVYLDPLF